MIFYAQNANFSHFFRRSLRSRFILSIILIEIWPNAKKLLLLQHVNTFNDFLHAPPPLRSNPGWATAVHILAASLFSLSFFLTLLKSFYCFIIQSLFV